MHARNGCLRHWSHRATAIAFCLLISAGGCSWLTPRPAAESFDNGYTIVLPGIEGRSVFNANLKRGLARANPDRAVEVHDWTTGAMPLFLYHLRGDERNRAEARRLVAKIVDYQDRHPGRPVFLVGHSGGAGMALLTAEGMPPGYQIDGIVLLAAAVSQDYDLRPALAKTRRGIWSYHSSGDVALLVAGTTMFGTHDGVHAPSAGAYGFRIPADADPADYAKVHQVPFDPDMITSGNFAGHFGATTATFAERYIAKHLR